MKVLIIDNFDSFTFNLHQLIGGILENESQDFTLDVFRNNEITVEEIKLKSYDRIVISPGPGDPSDEKYFGVCAKVLTDLGRTIPTLGVCLGMQGMANYFGGKVIRANLPMHGKTSSVVHDGNGIFRSLMQSINVMRYHSLIADPVSLPDSLQISAIVNNENSEENFENKLKKLIENQEYFEIMGLRHREFPIEGVQFHPESYASEGGEMMVRNFFFRK